MRRQIYAEIAGEILLCNSSPPIVLNSERIFSVPWDDGHVTVLPASVTAFPAFHSVRSFDGVNLGNSPTAMLFFSRDRLL